MVGYYTQSVLQEMEDKGASHVSTYFKPFFLFLHRIAAWIITPLIVMNNACAQLGKLGNPQDKGSKKNAGTIANLIKNSPDAQRAIYNIIINGVTSTVFIFLVNLLLFLLAATLLIASASLLVYGAAAFFSMEAMICFIACSALLCIVAILGCGGAINRKFTYLVPYITVLMIALAIQIAAIVLVYQSYTGGSGADDLNDATAHVQKGWRFLTQSISIEYTYSFYQFSTFNMCKHGTVFEDTYQQGQCVAHYHPPESFNISCVSERWLEVTVNTHCNFASELDMDRLKIEMTQAIADDNMPKLEQQVQKMQILTIQALQIKGCWHQKGVSLHSPTGTGVYCVCQSKIVEVVAHAKTIVHVAIALAVLQVLILCMSCHLIGVDVLKIAQLAKPSELARCVENPSALKGHFGVSKKLCV